MLSSCSSILLYIKSKDVLVSLYGLPLTVSKNLSRLNIMQLYRDREDNYSGKRTKILCSYLRLNTLKYCKAYDQVGFGSPESHDVLFILGTYACANNYIRTWTLGL